MRASLRTGITFGLTSAVITTLGLMVGLNSGTKSKLVVLGGVLTIAIADAFSDALGIHMSEESESSRSNRHVWGATISTFLAKSTFALAFAVPVFLLPLGTAIVASVAWGFFILSVLSYLIAKAQRKPPWKVIGEHVLIAGLVVVVTYWVGEWVSTFAG